MVDVVHFSKLDTTNKKRFYVDVRRNNTTMPEMLALRAH